MSSIIYVVPWAICDTDNIYIKKIDVDSAPVPEKGMEFEDWRIKDVMPSPDRRSKDIFAVIDVYNEYTDKANEKGMSVVSLSNSKEKLKSNGYAVASEHDRDFIRTRVLKADRAKR